jgi:hypothetical protein
MGGVGTYSTTLQGASFASGSGRTRGLLRSRVDGFTKMPSNGVIRHRPWGGRWVGRRCRSSAPDGGEVLTPLSNR